MNPVITTYAVMQNMICCYREVITSVTRNAGICGVITHEI